MRLDADHHPRRRGVERVAHIEGVTIAVQMAGQIAAHDVDIPLAIGRAVRLVDGVDAEEIVLVERQRQVAHTRLDGDVFGRAVVLGDYLVPRFGVTPLIYRLDFELRLGLPVRQADRSRVLRAPVVPERPEGRCVAAPLRYRLGSNFLRRDIKEERGGGVSETANVDCTGI